MRKLYLTSSIDLTVKLDNWQYVKVENDMYKIVEIERQTEPNQLKVK